MAPPTTSKPLRLLVALGVLIVGLLVWAFWPGTESTVRLGLDLQGGTQVILQPKPVTEGAEITEEQLTQTVSIIRQRVDGLGVAEAEVTTQGSGNGAVIIVSVPGVNQDRVVDLVQRTALLDFRPVWSIASPVSLSPVPEESPGATPEASPGATPEASPAATPAPSASADAASSADPSGSAAPSPSASAAPLVQATENTPEYQAQLAELDCTNPLNYTGGRPDDPEKWLGTCDNTGSAKYNLQPAFIQGTNVTNANAVLPQGGVGWVVSLEFDGEGAKALADASTQLSALPECGVEGASPCNAFAIVLDGVVTSAPRFNEPILGGSAQIEGNFTAQEARDLANILKYGALPVTLEPVDITTVSPTVGNDQLRAGIIAGLLGLLLVAIYLLLYYRALGLVAVVSLVVAAGILYLTFVVLSKMIGLTLTLAGVAGAIVAIGITADSFIIYFERIRDEIREGRTLRQACDTGWVRARRTLLAADFVSILAAVVLYFLSVGNVRGFAFVLGLTTLIDVLVAFWFTHPVVVMMGRSRWMQRGSKWTGLSADRLGRAPEVTQSASRSRRGRSASDTTEEVTA
ncbi:MAG TPA: protein translocase subunit SecD [Actinobacteria bacterium]|nr:protein translocase subunit SecD [Actinomycetota bacterium]